VLFLLVLMTISLLHVFFKQYTRPPAAKYCTNALSFPPRNVEFSVYTHTHAHTHTHIIDRR